MGQWSWQVGKNHVSQEEPSLVCKVPESCAEPLATSLALEVSDQRSVCFGILVTRVSFGSLMVWCCDLSGQLRDKDRAVTRSGPKAGKLCPCSRVEADCLWSISPVLPQRIDRRWHDAVGTSCWI